MFFRQMSIALAALVLLLVPAGAFAAPSNTGFENGNGHDKPANGNSSSTQGCNGTHHSNTGNGTNTSGPYDNTCDGSASENGVGSGSATGKPCAGCVGNADDKNPRGQMPGGSDANAGYECDRNQGIGKTNPAHTGCRVTSPPPVPTPVTPPAPAPPSPVLGETESPITSPAKGGGTVLGAIAEPAASPSSSLPFTGLALGFVVFSAIALIGAGFVMRFARRRQSRLAS